MIFLDLHSLFVNVDLDKTIDVFVQELLKAIKTVSNIHKQLSLTTKKKFFDHKKIVV